MTITKKIVAAERPLNMNSIIENLPTIKVFNTTFPEVYLDLDITEKKDWGN